jgi:hypothetical protein
MYVKQALIKDAQYVYVFSTVSFDDRRNWAEDCMNEPLLFLGGLWTQPSQVYRLNLTQISLKSPKSDRCEKMFTLLDCRP